MPSSGSSLRINGTCSSFSIQLLHYYYQAKNIPVSKLEGGIEPRRKLLNLDLVYTAPSIDRIWFTTKSGGTLDFGFARTSFGFREVLRISCGAS